MACAWRTTLGQEERLEKAERNFKLIARAHEVRHICDAFARGASGIGRGRARARRCAMRGAI